ncbi:MAG: AsmA family protein [Elusimicrobia bacterium]|nr:AsmA family protein [Elusimicrobiota bacterium]
MRHPFWHPPTWPRLFQAVVIGLLTSALAFITLTPAAFDRWIGAQTVASMLTAELEEATNRQFKISNVHFNWWQGLVLENVEISEEPTFREGPWASVRQVGLRPSFWKFIQGRIIVRRAVFYGLSVNLKRDEKGKWNVERLTSASRLTPAAPPAAATSPARPAEKIKISIDSVEIHDADIKLSDALGRIPSLTLREFDAQVGEIISDRPFEVKFVGWFDVRWNIPVKNWIRLLTQDPMRLEARLRGQIVHVGPEGPWIEIEKLFAETASWNAVFKSRMNPLTPSGFIEVKPDIKAYDVLLSSKPFHLAGQGMFRLEMSRRADGWVFDGGLEGKAIESSWGERWHKAAGVPLEIQSQLSWKEFEGEFSTGVPWQDSGLTYLDDRSRRHLLQGNLKVQLSTAPANSVVRWVVGWSHPGNTLRDQGQERGGGREPKWEVVLSSVAIYPQGLSLIIPGLSQFSMSDGGLRAEELSAWGGRGFWTLLANGIAAQGSGIRFNGDSIASMKIGFGRVLYSRKGKGWTAGFDGAAEFNSVNAKLIYCQELGAQGHLDGLANEKDPKINGLVSVYLTSGALTDVPRLVQVAPFMKFLIKPLQIIEDLNTWGVLKIKNQDFTALPMESMQSNYRFDNGKMSLDPVSLRGPVANAQASGGIDFPEDKINLVVAVQIPQEKSRLKLADAFSDAQGNLVLHIKVKGPLKRPDVYPVLGPKKDMLKELDGEIRALKETASKVLKGLVPSWLKKAVSR